MIRLNSPPPKLPYDLYAYNPTGIKLTIHNIADTKNPKTTNVTTRLLRLINPIHVNKDNNEKARARITYTNIRRPIANHKPNINHKPLKETRKLNKPTSQVARDIQPKIVNRIGRDE